MPIFNPMLAGGGTSGFMVSQRTNEEITYSAADFSINASIEVPEGYIPVCASFLLRTVNSFSSYAATGTALWDSLSPAQSPHKSDTSISVSGNRIVLKYIQSGGDEDGYGYIGTGYFVVVFTKKAG